MRKTVFWVAVYFVVHYCAAQGGELRPGFNKQEGLDMLCIAAHQIDTPWTKVSLPLPQAYRLEYRSPVVGLENRWDLFMAGDNTAIISVRGTTAASTSWLANIYEGMVPATGSLKLRNDYTFTYHLADDERATVHLGWLIALGSLVPDIRHKIDSCYTAGIKQIILTGHSQGGAITFLLTAYLRHLQKTGDLPNDIVFKTYCGAAPKPGNLYFAYDYEALTAGGWAFNVVNAADWVPEVPFSIQTDKDFVKTNPFANVNDIFKKQKFPVNIYLKSLYKSLTKPLKKSKDRFKKFNTKLIYKCIKKALPEYEQPVLADNNNYQRAGVTIVLLPDEEYKKAHPHDSTRLFENHWPGSYYELLQRLP